MMLNSTAILRVIVIALLLTACGSGEEERIGETAETIMNSLRVALPRISMAGEGKELLLDSVYEATISGNQPERLLLNLEADVPVLLFAHHDSAPEAILDPLMEVKVYDPQGNFVGQLTAGWLGTDGARCDPQTMSDCVATFPFGYVQPEALRFTTAEAGEYTITVAGGYDDLRGSYRLGAFDMRAGAPMVVDSIAQELYSGEKYVFRVESPADQPFMAYVRPTGSSAKDMTLSLTLIDEMGAEIKELHNYSEGGQPVFIDWTNREDSLYTVQLTEVDDKPADYELTILSDKLTSRALQAEQLPAYAEQYNVEIVVRENGDLAVVERFDLSRNNPELVILQRSLPLADLSQIAEVQVSEGAEAYVESGSLQPGTFWVTENNGRLLIQWALPTEANDPLEFDIDYLVKDALEVDSIETAIGEKISGSTLSWEAIPAAREFSIAHGQVKVLLPDVVALHRVEAFGGDGEATAPIEDNNFQPALSDQVTYNLERDLTADNRLEILIEFAPIGDTVAETERAAEAPGEGEPLEKGSPIIYDSELPNPFGGEPFPAFGELALIDGDSDEGTALIHWTQSFDPEFTRQIMVQTFTDMAMRLGNDPPTESDLPEPFLIKDYAVLREFLFQTEQSHPTY